MISEKRQTRGRRPAPDPALKLTDALLIGSATLFAYYLSLWSQLGYCYALRIPSYVIDVDPRNLFHGTWLPFSAVIMAAPLWLIARDTVNGRSRIWRVVSALIVVGIAANWAWGQWWLLAYLPTVLPMLAAPVLWWMMAKVMSKERHRYADVALRIVPLVFVLFWGAVLAQANGFRLGFNRSMYMVLVGKPERVVLGWFGNRVIYANLDRANKTYGPNIVVEILADGAKLESREEILGKLTYKP